MLGSFFAASSPPLCRLQTPSSAPVQSPAILEPFSQLRRTRVARMPISNVSYSTDSSANTNQSKLQPVGTFPQWLSKVAELRKSRR